MVWKYFCIAWIYLLWHGLLYSMVNFVYVMLAQSEFIYYRELRAFVLLCLCLWSPFRNSVRAGSNEEWIGARMTYPRDHTP
jgi:hypothetical protein